ncbi:MAG: aminoacyl-histidine dipeptidase [Saccharofermentans sp.]|nr:aminoacyl-histidine dipeptidase [Saccharofermentans sp.]
MGVLSDLQPALVWKYFEQICAIPHGSGNEQAISNYIVDFARTKGLKYVQDKVNNVIIWAPGTGDKQEHAPVILQGHMDMVAQKLPDCDINMETDGLRLKLGEDIVYAEGTTLGGDDGVAVAYMMAILDDVASGNPSIIHPPLECVFTVDEECGMTGASSLDMTLLKGRTMVNLDSEDEGYLLVSCAGGVGTLVTVPFERVESDYVAGLKSAKVVISGLTGGHSGCEIHRGRANADVLMGRVLEELVDIDYKALLYSVNGGDKDNVIPSRSEAVIATENLKEFTETVSDLRVAFAQEFKDTDPGLKMEVIPCDVDVNPMDYESRDKIIAALNTIPNGVQKMSPDIEDLPETSLNLGVMVTDDTEVRLTYLVRSNVDASKDELKARIEAIAGEIGAGFSFSGDYPGWAYRKDSALRDIMFQTFVDMYGREPVVQAIHAGVECGMFAQAIDDFDAVSIGPDMMDIHTPGERLYVESTKRVWEYLLEVLARL